jgi:hypothetical protein
VRACVRDFSRKFLIGGTSPEALHLHSVVEWEYILRWARVSQCVEASEGLEEWPCGGFPERGVPSRQQNPGGLLLRGHLTQWEQRRRRHNRFLPKCGWTRVLIDSCRL